MPAVKLGGSRQVVIPKKIHDKLGLVPGDYLEVEARQGKLILTPKTLIEKEIKERLAEGLEDIRTGRVTGPFRSAKELIRSLRSHKVTRRRKV